jgi:hypothetical protein
MSNFDRQNTWLSLQPITGVKFSDGTTQTTAHSSDDATPEGTSVKSTTNSNETSGKVLTADGDGTCSWQAASTGAIKAVRVAMGGSHTHFGADAEDDAGNVNSLATTSVTLDASTTYLIEWSINLAEGDDSGDDLSGQIDFSTDGGSYTKMYDVNQYELKAGGAGLRYDNNYSMSLIHAFTTNGSGGTYYFQFDTNDTADRWDVHDFNVKIFECSDYAGGQTYTQS